MPHTVVTTTSSTTTSDGGIFNQGYIFSIQGLLKIAQMVTLLIGYLCIHCSRYSDPALTFFEVVTLWFLIAFLIFYLMYVLRLQSKIPCINWTLTEFLHYALGTLLVLIASIVVIVKGGGYSQLVAGSVFGFIATVLMAGSLWTTYQVTCGSQPTSVSM